ncbi:MAG: TspO/MBR family protein [Candidatus Izemoplasmataceae bacterium]
MKIILLKSLMLIVFIVMITMNVLANSLPLNNQTTGEISAKYPSLFTPAGITFSIWGIIYLLLMIYVGTVLLIPAMQIDGTYKETVIILFIFSSIFNTLWLLCWHYDKIFLSTIVMILLLITLGAAFKIIPSSDAFTKTAFSVYFGWISIATIANVTILLVSRNFTGFGISEPIWLVVILLIGIIILSILLYQTGDVVYGIVFIWAYFGIFLRHYTQQDLPQSYPLITLYILILLLLSSGLTAYTYFVNNFHFFRD